MPEDKQAAWKERMKEANQKKKEQAVNELEEAFVKAKDFLTPDQLAKMRGLIDMLK